MFLLNAGAARAQLAPDSARLVVKFGLLRLLFNTYQAEVEGRITGQMSLNLSPRLVAGTVPASVSATANNAGDQVQGVGLSLGPRLYIPNTGNEGARLAGLYLGLKADYQHLRLTFTREAWGEDMAPDGLRYYIFRSRELTERIRRVGGVAALGYQCQAFHPRLRLDASFNYNLVSSSSSAGSSSFYLSSPSDYAYTGRFLSVDLNLGFVLK